MGEARDIPLPSPDVHVHARIHLNGLAEGMIPAIAVWTSVPSLAGERTGSVDTCSARQTDEGEGATVRGRGGFRGRLQEPLGSGLFSTNGQDGAARARGPNAVSGPLGDYSGLDRLKAPRMSPSA